MKGRITSKGFRVPGGKGDMYLTDDGGRSPIAFPVDTSLLRYENEQGQYVLGSNISTYNDKFTWYSGESTIFTLSFTPTNLLSIFVNGLKLYKQTQYTIQLPNQIQILQNLEDKDVVEFNYEHFAQTPI